MVTEQMLRRSPKIKLVVSSVNSDDEVHIAEFSDNTETDRISWRPSLRSSSLCAGSTENSELINAQARTKSLSMVLSCRQSYSHRARWRPIEFHEKQ